MQESIYITLIKAIPTLILLVWIILIMTSEKGKLFVGVIRNKLDFFAFFLLILVYVISMLRNNSPFETLLFEINKITLLIALIVFIYMFISNKIRQGSTLLHLSEFTAGALIFFPTVFVWVNLFLHLVGVEANDATLEIPISNQATMLGALGWDTDRVMFPFSNGMNNYGNILGGVMLLNIAGIIAYQSFLTRIVLGCNVAVCIYSLLLTDSRTAIVNTFMVMIFIYFLLKIRKIHFLKVFIVLIPFLPLTIPILSSYIGDYEFFKAIQRSSSDLETGNERLFIWGIALFELSQFKAMQLIGYGEYGHYGSGVSQMWADVFANSELPELKTAHNHILQTIFDSGYIGLAVFFFAYWRAMKTAISMFRENNKIAIILITFLLYYFLSGSSEVIYGAYNRNYTFLFISVLIITYSLKNEFIKIKKKEESFEKDLTL